MRNIISFAFLLLLATSCINEEFSSLELSEDNIFGGAGPDLFTVVNVEQSVQVGNLRRLRVEFTSVYDEVPTIQRESIDAISVITPNRGELIAVSRTHFVSSELESGTEACFSLAFFSNDSEVGSSRATEFCIQVE